MTNEEAKHCIRTLLEVGGCDGFDYKQKEALDMAIKALEQQPCEDMSALEYRDKLRELFIKAHYTELLALIDFPTEQNFEALNNLIDKGWFVKENMQQLCEDCISREEMLSLQTEYAEKMGATTFWKLRDDIRALPSVTPQRPKGKWVEVDVRNCHATLKCSVCDRVIEPTFTFGEYSYENIKAFYPYCHCGAEMSGGGEDGKDSACD